MIDFFETGVRIDPLMRLFTFVDSDSREVSYTYSEARIVAASLARRLHSSGVNAGDVVLVNLPNCPEFVFVALACAYGGFAMALVDGSLSDAEALTCKLELERAGHRVAMQFDRDAAQHILSCVWDMPEDLADVVMYVYGRSRRGRSIMGERQDALDDTIHFAERSSRLFASEALAVIAFVKESGIHDDATRSKIRPVPLTWSNLVHASQALIERLSDGDGEVCQERLPFNSFSDSDSGSLDDGSERKWQGCVWQCVLPLSKVAGFQTLIRSVIERTPLSLYAVADSEQMLRDVELGYATHIAVDDALLRDLATIEEWRREVAPRASSRLSLYKGILLIGRTSDPRTVQRACDLGACVTIGYGMPQTSGEVALASACSGSQSGLIPLNGCEMRVIDPDEDGCGRLAVRGMGVFDGYLNSRTAFTVDGFYITDDKAVVEDGLVRVRHRSQKMFVSAGQRIYPVEVADVLRHVDGVSGVHVFGVPDASCGMLPIAAVERSDSELTSQCVADSARSWFQWMNIPIKIFVFDKLPRTTRGKLDRSAIEALFAVGPS